MKAAAASAQNLSDSSVSVERQRRASGALGRSLLNGHLGFVLIVIAIADAGRFADPDLWWHMLSGQHALRTGHFLLHETFSYSAAGYPWIDHERFAELILALCYVKGGILTLKLFKLLCSGTTILLIAAALAETDADIRLQMAIIMAIAIALGPEIQFRPQLFSFIGLALVMLVLTRYNRDSRVRLWPLIILFGLWANLHGGYIAGLAAVAIFGAVTTLTELPHERSRFWQTAGRFIALLIACSAASLLTPFGFNNWRAISRTLTNPATHQVIQEWRPLLAVMVERVRETPSAGILYTPVLTLMLATIVSAILTPRSDDLPLVAIAAIFIAAAFFAIRNIELALITLAAPLANHAQLVLDEIHQPEATGNDQTSHGAGGIRQAVFPAAAVLIMGLTGLFSPLLPTGIAYPAAALTFMRQHNLTGDVLCDFNWGGYFIYHMSPSSKVFIDNRYDLAYPDSVIRDYLDFRSARDINRVLDSYPHQFVLISPDSPPYQKMMLRRDWTLVYQDSVAALFARVAVVGATRVTRGNSSPSYFP
jgi:hypothetical protein